MPGRQRQRGVGHEVRRAIHVDAMIAAREERIAHFGKPAIQREMTRQGDGELGFVAIRAAHYTGFMTGKQRILAAFHGERPDTVPFCPNLYYWFYNRLAAGTLPPAIEGVRKSTRLNSSHLVI